MLHKGPEVAGHCISRASQFRRRRSFLSVHVAKCTIDRQHRNIRLKDPDLLKQLRVKRRVSGKIEPMTCKRHQEPDSIRRHGTVIRHHCPNQDLFILIAFSSVQTMAAVGLYAQFNELLLTAGRPEKQGPFCALCHNWNRIIIEVIKMQMAGHIIIYRQLFRRDQHG